ncbi:hypothetical protein CYMTET_47398 [Cymbomonas tetramitiformis]|uniref:Uncharacterized protein n=1 Tax=Cymbomonas tetramitiformis TaxID=36881 RepID=A0AAE0BUD0_9CHLO|nr:hypothetical protein CYMTET_47398 [Cymbomonas tetramitiformis]
MYIIIQHGMHASAIAKLFETAKGHSVGNKGIDVRRFSLPRDIIIASATAASSVTFPAFGDVSHISDTSQGSFACNTPVGTVKKITTCTAAPPIVHRGIFTEVDWAVPTRPPRIRRPKRRRSGGGGDDDDGWDGNNGWGGGGGDDGGSGDDWWFGGDAHHESGTWLMHAVTIACLAYCVRHVLEVEVRASQGVEGPIFAACSHSFPKMEEEPRFPQQRRAAWPFHQFTY